jgi:hypothetical protein
MRYIKKQAAPRLVLVCSATTNGDEVEFSKWSILFQFRTALSLLGDTLPGGRGGGYGDFLTKFSTKLVLNPRPEAFKDYAFAEDTADTPEAAPGSVNNNGDTGVKTAEGSAGQKDRYASGHGKGN